MDTKLCPFCGKEIAASAETCEHCLQPLPLDNAESVDKTAQELTEKNTAELEANMPDWLKEARQGETEDNPESENEANEVDPLAWLAELDSAEDEDEETSADWLVNLQAETQTPPAQEKPLEKEQETKTASSEKESSDELTGIAQVLQDDLSQDAEIEGEELPDWLSTLQGESLSEEEISLPDLESEENEPKGTGSLVSDDDLPEWLSADEDDQKIVSKEAPEKEELPEWMTASAAEEDISVLQADESKTPAANDLPEWLSAADAPSSAEREKEDEAELTSAADLPDWVAALQPADTSPDEIEQEATQEENLSLGIEAIDGQPSAQAFVSSEAQEGDAVRAELPEWLSQVKQTEPSEEEGQADVDASHPDEETPAWLEELPSVKLDAGVDFPEENKQADVFDGGIEDTDEIFGIEMPDWLSSLSPEETEEELAAEEVAETNISGVELPSWVQAMRPVEDVVSETADDAEHVVADTGPLAGLSGVLPAAAGFGRINKPKAHSIRLQISDSQKKGAALLEELLSEERKPVSVQQRERVSSIPLVRWGIALLLFLVVGFSLLSGSTMISLPADTSPEVQDTIDILNRLPEGETVLLVFDYEAGFSGEMKTIAAPLVEQLLSRGEKITLLSTLPLGTTIGEAFLSETQSIYEFQSGVNYRNLGYLPGGSSGILNFVSSPRQVIALREEGLSVWESEPLDTVHRLSDFALVLVLSDDAEGARIWIEQAAKPLNDAKTPFIMAVSAQAEPMIYPYYVSGQLDGLVSGLFGGASYEQARNELGLGRKYWDAYGLGLFLAEILLVLGALVNFLAAWNARRREQKEED